jgi:hypothetical protein
MKVDMVQGVQAADIRLVFACTDAGTRMVDL